MSTTIFRKFWRLLCYCKPNSKVYKKTLVKFFKKVKNCALNLIYRHQLKIVLFGIILQNMLLDEVFRMVVVVVVVCLNRCICSVQVSWV